MIICLMIEWAIFVFLCTTNISECILTPCCFCVVLYPHGIDFSSRWGLTAFELEDDVATFLVIFCFSSLLQFAYRSNSVTLGWVILCYAFLKVVELFSSYFWNEVVLDYETIKLNWCFWIFLLYENLRVRCFMLINGNTVFDKITPHFY